MPSYIRSISTRYVGMHMQRDGLHLTLLLSPFDGMRLHACNLPLKGSILLLNLGKLLL